MDFKTFRSKVTFMEEDQKLQIRKQYIDKFIDKESNFYKEGVA